MTIKDLSKEELLKMVNSFEHYPAVTAADDREHILAYLDDEACGIGKHEIKIYLDEYEAKINESSEHVLECLYLLSNTNDNKKHIMSLSDIINDINRDRSDEWTRYDLLDWKDGLANFTEFELIECIGTITQDNINKYYEFMSDDLEKYQDLFICVYNQANIGERWKIVDFRYINWTGWFFMIPLQHKCIVEYLIKSQNKETFDFRLLKSEFDELAINPRQKL